jgi:DNA-binding SARP family transcriptional activator
MTKNVPLRLMLLGGFVLQKGDREIVIAASGQRLIALLALHRRPLTRLRAAGTLWPEFSTKRSLADLRTTLWRINQSGEAIVTASQSAVALNADIDVDVLNLMALTRQLDQAAVGLEQADLDSLTVTELTSDLLPDWYDEWVQDERESLRQIRLHGLETLAAALSRAGRHADAIQAALAAIRMEPLRETAHRTLIEAHLAEGNWSEARRQFGQCRRLLREELGVEPSESMRRLVKPDPVLAGSRVLYGGAASAVTIPASRRGHSGGDKDELVRQPVLSFGDRNPSASPNSPLSSTGRAEATTQSAPARPCGHLVSAGQRRCRSRSFSSYSLSSRFCSRCSRTSAPCSSTCSRCSSCSARRCSLGVACPSRSCSCRESSSSCRA